ncbi:hypothetical protein Plhal304r1_c027g0091541 [Plasmopara halstedii]
MQRTNQLSGSSKCCRSMRSTQKAATAYSDAFQCTNIQSQDPTKLAQFCVDHFSAREASILKLTKTQPMVRASVNLRSFNTRQIGERCLSTHRLLFGRPLWAGASPRPRKRKHTVDSTVDFSNTEPLPTVDELLELQLSGMFNVTSRTNRTSEYDNSLMDVAMDFETEVQSTATEESFELLWELDACEDSGDVTCRGRNKEMHLLNADTKTSELSSTM